MKNLIALLVLSLTSASVSYAQVESQGLLNDKRTIAVRLQIEKKKLLEKLAIEIATAAVLNDEVEFIEDYSSGELNMADLEALLAEHPVASNATFIPAVYAVAKILNDKVINPALASQTDDSLVARILKRFPKLSKRAAYAIATVATAASIYVTIESALHYADLVNKTQPELDALYLQKNAELIRAKNNVVLLERELFGVNTMLNKLNVSETKKLYYR